MDKQTKQPKAIKLSKTNSKTNHKPTSKVTHYQKNNINKSQITQIKINNQNKSQTTK